jgi:ParB/RepB/Spo0J family partition protein
MAAATPLMIPVDKIVVQEGHNARKSFDPKALKRLGKSISANDLIEPLSVRPIDGGKFMLLAGERRLRAAKLEGIKELPGHVNTKGDARTIALVENIQREQLNKVEEAEGVEELAKELKLTTNKAIAEEIGMSDKWVSVRRRILTLPRKVQDAIARDAVPIEAVSLLKKAADASPRIAECVCEVFEGDEAYTDFVRDFSDMLTAVADGAVDDPPTMIDPAHIRFSEVFDKAKERDKHVARYRAAVPYVPGPQMDPIVSLGEAEMTVARAAKVLLEHKYESGSYSYTTTFLIDTTWGKDLVVSAIERAEKAKKRREKEEKKRAKESGDSSDNGNDLSTQKAENEWAKKREAAKKEAEERRQAAAAFNDRLGHALMKHRTVENRKKFGLPRAKAAAIALVRHDCELAAAGLRLVLPALQQGQMANDGDDTKTGKVTYATTTQAMEFLVGKIEACRSISEVNEWVALAQLAAAIADEDALKSGEGGTYRYDPAEAQVKELLAEEIKAVKPRRSPRQRKEEKETASV